MFIKGDEMEEIMLLCFSPVTYKTNILYFDS